MAWFWFTVAVLAFGWNVFLMWCNHEQADTIRTLQRRLVQQGVNFLLAWTGDVDPDAPIDGARWDEAAHQQHQAEVLAEARADAAVRELRADIDALERGESA